MSGGGGCSVAGTKCGAEECVDLLTAAVDDSPSSSRSGGAAAKMGGGPSPNLSTSVRRRRGDPAEPRPDDSGHGGHHGDGGCAGRCLCLCHYPQVYRDSTTTNHAVALLPPTSPTTPKQAHKSSSGGLFGTLRRKFGALKRKDSDPSQRDGGVAASLSSSPSPRHSAAVASSSERSCERNGAAVRSRTLPRSIAAVVSPMTLPRKQRGDAPDPAGHGKYGGKHRSLRESVFASATLSPSFLSKRAACHGGRMVEKTALEVNESEVIDRVLASVSRDDARIGPDTGYGHTSAPVCSDCAGSVTPTDLSPDGLSDGDDGMAASPPPVATLTKVPAAQPVYDHVKGELTGWSLTRELAKLPRYGWYWGPISRSEAEEKLAGQQDGAFLLRDSSDERYLLSLSFRSYGRTLHTRVEHCNGLFSFYAQTESEGYSSIVDLIEHSMTDSQSGVFCYSRARTPGSPSFPVRLARPMSRFTQVRSLQYLCRFVIRLNTRVDYIQKLPLPTSIKGWLEETQY